MNKEVGVPEIIGPGRLKINGEIKPDGDQNQDPERRVRSLNFG